MMLARLCFVLPVDSDDFDSELKKSYPPPSKNPTRKHLQHLISLARRSFACFCRRRCPCLHSLDLNHSSDSEFHDTAGFTYDSTKPNAPRTFSYAELYIGTNGFSDKELLGSGGFGRVYRAVLPGDGSSVAVKCVAGGDPSFEKSKSFAAELVAVAQLRHRNLVRLRGWCSHDDRLLLVYDYMPNRSLDRLLFAPSSPDLGFDRRRKILAGLSAALFYLHEQLDTQIIHRDVKASNVMLDSGFNARLGDFGLARWIEHGGDAERPMRALGSLNYEFRITETSRIGGTIGYLPPESFQRRSTATAKSDVFSFGIVMLEVASGRRSVDLAHPDDKIFLLDWVRRLADDGDLAAAGDKKLLLDGNRFSIERLLHLGLLCSLHDPQSRPSMKWVTETLVSGDSADDLPPLPFFHCQPFYYSLSSSSSGSSVTVLSSSFLTAAGSTVYLTANEEASQQWTPPFPIIDAPRSISYKEIIEITDNFSESKQVAELDFGTGYSGMLDGRFHVLVKRLGMKTCPALRVRFSDELSNLARLRHRHLLQLRGWCTEHGEMLVVYDHPCGGVLSRRLFDPRRTAPLSWPQRRRIIKALASAILYLHEEWEEEVIHRGISSSAVWLDPDASSRLGGFALAEFLSRGGGCHGRGAPRGIFGYMSPEYMEGGAATAASDVYSFGVVVLEVVGGRAAVDLRRRDSLLVRRAWEVEAGRRDAEGMADHRLEGRFVRTELERVVRLGAACTRSQPDKRPSMRQIVSALDGNEEAVRAVIGRPDARDRRREWAASNSAALDLVRRMKALGIH